MKELAIRIKDDWFLYIIGLCLQGFNKGIPLGFYISQWLANYLLEPLDRLITEVLGLPKLQRYMDDIVIFASSKKVLQRAIVEIRKMLGQRFRLKLKHNYQVCKFYYEKGKRKIGRALDFMGFIFYRKQDADQKEHHAIRNTVGKEDGEVKGSKPWILSQTHRSHAVVHGMVYLHGHIRLLPEQDKTLYPCGPA